MIFNGVEMAIPLLTTSCKCYQVLFLGLENDFCTALVQLDLASGLDTTSPVGISSATQCALIE